MVAAELVEEDAEVTWGGKVAKDAALAGTPAAREERPVVAEPAAQAEAEP